MLLLNQHANVIANVTTPVALVMTEIEDHIKMKLISQLISNISKFLQKLLKYTNGTAISTFFVLPSL